MQPLEMLTVNPPDPHPTSTNQAGRTKRKNESVRYCNSAPHYRRITVESDSYRGVFLALTAFTLNQLELTQVLLSL
jgi:hypothetical protein